MGRGAVMLRPDDVDPDIEGDVNFDVSGGTNEAVEGRVLSVGVEGSRQENVGVGGTRGVDVAVKVGEAEGWEASEAKIPRPREAGRRFTRFGGGRDGVHGLECWIEVSVSWSGGGSCWSGVSRPLMLV